jgi:outer membrane receptor for ferrienterochelin and colicins
MSFLRTAITFAILFTFYRSDAQVIAVFSSKTNLPVADAVVYIQSLESNKKPEYRFTEASGEVINPFLGKCLVTITHLSYLHYADTIEQDHGRRSIFLTPREVELPSTVILGQYYESGAAYSVSKVKVIDAKRIEQQAAVNLKDVLEQELNIRIEQDPILGSGISVQGVAGQNVKILLDGVPITGREAGSIDLSQINLNNIERIEYIEGPMSVSYGSDALGGVINLISKKTGKGKLEAGGKAYYGTVGQYNFDWNLGFNRKAASLKVSGGRYFFGGYSPREITGRNKTWKPKEQYFSSIMLVVPLKKKLELKYTGDFFIELITNRGDAVINAFEAYAFDDDYWTQRYINKIFIDKRLKNNAQVQLINSHSFYGRAKNTFRKNLVTLERNLTRNESDQDTTLFSTFNFRGAYSSNKITTRLNFQAGYDIVLESARGAKLVGDNKSINDYAAYASAEYKPTRKLVLRPAARMAYNSRYGAPFVYSFNLKYDLDTSYVLRASYARGFRSPGLKELNLYFVDINHYILGNENLQAEFSDNVQVSLSWFKARKERIFKLEPSLFYNNIYNMITLALVDASTQLYTYVNTDRFTSTGAAVSGEFKNKHWTIAAGYSLTGRNNRILPESITDPLQFSSEYRGSVNYSFLRFKMDVSLFYKHNGVIRGYALDENQAVVSTMVGSYNILDAVVNKSFINRTLVLGGGVKNILNVNNINRSGPGSVHAGDASIPAAMGRNFFISLKWNYSSTK